MQTLLLSSPPNIANNFETKEWSHLTVQKSNQIVDWFIQTTSYKLFLKLQENTPCQLDSHSGVQMKSWAE
jgi:hypothetical protein